MHDGPDKMHGLLQRLQSVESMAFPELRSAGCHEVAVESLSKQARDRLLELQHDDVDELYSLRITGRERVIGIRHGSVVKLLWWDPFHEVYPSPKRHT